MTTKGLAVVAVFLLFVAVNSGAAAAIEPDVPADVTSAEVLLVLHTYEVRFRMDGRVSTTRVQANDAGQAKKLVKAQYGDKVTVLSTKRVD